MKKILTCLAIAVLPPFLPLCADFEGEESEIELFNLDSDFAALEAELAREEEALTLPQQAEQEPIVLEEPVLDPEPALASEETSLPQQEERASEVALEEQPLIEIPLFESEEVQSPHIAEEISLSAPIAQLDLPTPALFEEAKPEETASQPAAEEMLPPHAEATQVVLAAAPAALGLNINFSQVFAGAPIIYTILFLMSVAGFFIWFYSLLRIKQAGALSPALQKILKDKLHSNQFDEAYLLCKENNNIFCRMIAAGIHSRKYGIPILIDAMKAEGKRATVSFWSRLALLNDIAIIAPLLGLLGTVMGMFYAFYNLNRSLESFTALFDGLGISVGTTVGGLVVAIAAMILHSIARYRLVRVLARVENAAESYAPLITNYQELR